MDCLIKIIQGPETGQEFRCSGLETILGRSPRSHIRLGSPSVSFEHAVISRNGDEFYIENLSAAGTFINDEKISGRTRLRMKDRVRIGQETIARVEALPSVGADAGRRRVLVISVLLMLMLLLLVLVADPLGNSQPNVNWRGLYVKLDEWVHAEVSQGRLPAEVEQYLHEAWRLREAGDAVGARKQWVRLRVLLAGLEDKAGVEPDIDRGELGLLLHPPKEGGDMTETQMAKALIQFVGRMEKGR